MPLDDTEIIAGQQDADVSGDYGYLAFKMASANANELEQLKQILEECEKLSTALANMVVVPDGQLIIGEGYSTLQLPESAGIDAIDPTQFF